MWACTRFSLTNLGASEFMSHIVPKNLFVAASAAVVLSTFGFFFFSESRNFLPNLKPMPAFANFCLHARNCCLKTRAVSVFWKQLVYERNASHPTRCML